MTLPSPSELCSHFPAAYSGIHHTKPFFAARRPLCRRSLRMFSRKAEQAHYETALMCDHRRRGGGQSS